VSNVNWVRATNVWRSPKQGWRTFRVGLCRVDCGACISWRCVSQPPGGIELGIRNVRWMSFTFVGRRKWVSLLSEMGYYLGSDESEIEIRFRFCPRKGQG
jgi:hypothetical protein